SATAYNFGTNSNFTGYWANDIATPELTWEKTKQFDLGLESATAYNFGTNSNFTGYWANDIATPELTWEKTK
ncbi:hypothetical protein E7X19_26790, partial [Bacteroides fragilis]